MKETKKMSTLCKILGINAGIALALASCVVDDGSWSPAIVGLYAAASVYAFYKRLSAEGLNGDELDEE